MGRKEASVDWTKYYSFISYNGSRLYASRYPKIRSTYWPILVEVRKHKFTLIAHFTDSECQKSKRENVGSSPKKYTIVEDIDVSQHRYQKERKAHLNQRFSRERACFSLPKKLLWPVECFAPLFSCYSRNCFKSDSTQPLLFYLAAVEWGKAF